VPVLLTEKSDVDRATANLGQINVIRATIRGGQVLEQKNIEEPAEQRIAANEVADGPAFVRQFLLNTADKYDLFAHR
jgi:hypothetical protein